MKPSEDPVAKAINEGENRYRQTVLSQGPLPGYPRIERDCHDCGVCPTCIERSEAHAERSQWANDRGPVNFEQRLVVERDVLRFYLREIRHAVRLTRPENGRSKVTMSECLDWIDTMASAALQGAPFPKKD